MPLNKGRSSRLLSRSSLPLFPWPPATFPRDARRSHSGFALRVTHGSRRATTKDENGPRHLCFVFNAIGSYFHRSEGTTEIPNESSLCSLSFTFSRFSIGSGSQWPKARFLRSSA